MEQKLRGTLTVQQATALARYDCEELDLGDLGTGVGLGTIIDDKSLGGGLTTLNADAAEAAAEFKGTGLVIPALAMLDAATAKALAKFKGRLYLPGLTAPDSGAAAALRTNPKANFPGR